MLLPPAWYVRRKQCLEQFSVVLHLEVKQLVHDDIILKLRRLFVEINRKCDNAFRRTRPPLMPHLEDADLPRRNLQPDAPSVDAPMKPRGRRRMLEGSCLH
jgi:hypothetical protein